MFLLGFSEAAVLDILVTNELFSCRNIILHKYWHGLGNSFPRIAELLSYSDIVQARYSHRSSGNFFFFLTACALR